MKLNQIVYVVIDHEEEKVIGAFNDYTTAKRVAYDMNKLYYDGSEISITPVLVDTVNWTTDSRQYYLTEQEVLDATQEEIDLARPNEDEDEEEDEEEDEDIWDDEDEDEDDDENDDDDDESHLPVLEAIEEMSDAIANMSEALRSLLKEMMKDE